MTQSLLVRVSELKAQMNTTSSLADARLRTLISQAGDLIEKLCDRRFDEYIDTFYYTARQVDAGGDLIGRSLALDHDLKSVSQVLNGDLIAVIPRLLPRNLPTKFFLELSDSEVWVVNPNGSHDDIAVSGVWGYRGKWESKGTLAVAITSPTATTCNVSDETLYEIGDLIRIDQEYCYVSNVAVNLTITRGFNGSVAATHLIGAPVDLFVSDGVVRHVIKRLVQWHMKQAESALTNQVVVGDFSMITSVDATPDDIRSLIKTLKRRPRMGG